MLGPLRMRFLMALVLLAVVWAVLTGEFLWEWRHEGDVHAQALGSLLSFFASIITAAVTLVYLHLTRRSLAAAEAAIQLQREQWETRMTVKPRFWLMNQASEPGPNGKPHTAVAVTYRKDVAEHYRKDPGHGHHYYTSMSWPLFGVDVWNDGERSMRVSSYRVWVRDEEGIHITRPLVGFVVPPNELRSFPVTEELIALAFRRRAFEERYERAPCADTVVGLRLYYSDWRDDDHASHDEYYLLMTNDGTGDVLLEPLGHRLKQD